MINVKKITDLQYFAVELWHNDKFDISESQDGFLALVLEQHRHNYNLWHEEDIARSPDVGDIEVARVKRSIDKLNQMRNDWIEKLDAVIIDRLDEAQVVPRSDAGLNTETPGSAIDRLSIMSLRIYHLREQLERQDTTPEHRRNVSERLKRCFQQHTDLSQSLTELLEDLFEGRKYLKVYHQFKMYNDPSMNPYLYNRKKPA